MYVTMDETLNALAFALYLGLIVTRKRCKKSDEASDAILISFFVLVDDTY